MLKFCAICDEWLPVCLSTKVGLCTISREKTYGETVCLHDKQEEEENE